MCLHRRSKPCSPPLAKSAVGTGLGGFALCDLAVLRRESGAPYFALTGPAAAWAAEQGVTVHLSLTHERGLANAIVILEKV